MSKFSKEEKADIRQRRKNGETMQSIADVYGITLRKVRYCLESGYLEKRGVKRKREVEVQKNFKKITKQEFEEIKARRPNQGKSYKEYIKIANKKRKEKGWFLFKIPGAKGCIGKSRVVE